MVQPGANNWSLPTSIYLSLQDKKDFVDLRVKRLLKAGVISALACMVKADSAILTDQSKELLARCNQRGMGRWGGRGLGGGTGMLETKPGHGEQGEGA